VEGVALLGEPLTWVHATSGALIVGGIAWPPCAGAARRTGRAPSRRPAKPGFLATATAKKPVFYAKAVTRPSRKRQGTGDRARPSLAPALRRQFLQHAGHGGEVHVAQAGPPTP
jgi:hypothetical protein